MGPVSRSHILLRDLCEYGILSVTDYRILFIFTNLTKHMNIENAVLNRKKTKLYSEPHNTMAVWNPVSNTGNDAAEITQRSRMSAVWLPHINTHV